MPRMAAEKLFMRSPTLVSASITAWVTATKKTATKPSAHCLRSGAGSHPGILLLVLLLVLLLLAVALGLVLLVLRLLLLVPVPVLLLRLLVLALVLVLLRLWLLLSPSSVISFFKKGGASISFPSPSNQKQSSACPKGQVVAVSLTDARLTLPAGTEPC